MSRDPESTPNSTCVDDTTLWTLESGRVVVMKDLLHGDYVYHVECEGMHLR